MTLSLKSELRLNPGNKIPEHLRKIKNNVKTLQTYNEIRRKNSPFTMVERVGLINSNFHPWQQYVEISKCLSQVYIRWSPRILNFYFKKLSSYTGFLTWYWARHDVSASKSAFQPQPTIKNINLSTLSPPEMGPPTTNSEAALRTSIDSSFKTKRTDSNDKILISAWTVVLNDESKPCSGEMTFDVNYEPYVKHGNRPA